MVRIASATGVPCATRTSTWRSFATISSGLCLFLDMGPSSFGSYEPYLRADHFMGGGSSPRRRDSTLRQRAALNPDGSRGVKAYSGSHTASGRWTRVEDSWVGGERIGWCTMSRGGEPWRG